MKRLLTLLAACIAACAATAQSRIETFTFRSALLDAEKTCSVYLPAGYDDSGRSYPVLSCCTAPAATTATGPKRATCARSPTRPSPPARRSR